MGRSEELFLHILRAAVHGEHFKPTDNDRQYLVEVYGLAVEHYVLPMVADCAFDERQKDAVRDARDKTIAQACRTADFLILLRQLAESGLRPLVVKGIVCRNLYPEPEQRPSADEDLLIRPEEYDAYREALEKRGLLCDSDEDAYEVSFASPDYGFLLEVHKSLLSAESEAFRDCGRFFESAIDRAVEVCVYGVPVRTLAPTDHLLFLICHAYKHFLHGGVGIRQICDLALMAEKDGARADWTYIRNACAELSLEVFAAALFQIAAKHLGFDMPEAFADLAVDGSDLLEDSLSGGLYGWVDIDRTHSSTMTLEAVEADRGGRKRSGLLRSVFLPKEKMMGSYPYLKDRPWLLPVAWIQRIWNYLMRKTYPDPINPARSIRIASERIDLLREYRIIQ